MEFIDALQLGVGLTIGFKNEQKTLYDILGFIDTQITILRFDSHCFIFF